MGCSLTKGSAGKSGKTRFSESSVTKPENMIYELAALRSLKLVYTVSASLADVLPNSSLDKGVDTSFRVGRGTSLNDSSGSNRTIEAHMESSVLSALNFMRTLAKSKGLMFMVSASNVNLVLGVAD